MSRRLRMIARKRLNRDDSKLSSNIESTLTSGYSSVLGKPYKQLNTDNGRSLDKPTTCVNCSTLPGNEVCIPRRQHLAARPSVARTSISITSYMNVSYADQRSSQTITSWIMSNNMTRLKTAYRYLTPIIDDIISRATSYTQREFKEILIKRQPICSISYTQYIRAYQASEIISQVGKELSSINTNMPYQVNFGVNNVATIKKEDLLENIERMADRIFIDRDLMKQLVNLHELITEMIRKLKISLEQVSVEGISPETQEALKNSDQFEGHVEHEMDIDRDAIRKHIAEHFIVIGEPKSKGCHCYDGPQRRAHDIDSTLSEEQSGDKYDQAIINQNSIVLKAHIGKSSQPMQQSKETKYAKRNKKANVKVKSINVNISKIPKRSKFDSSPQRLSSQTSLSQNDLRYSDGEQIFTKRTITKTGDNSRDRAGENYSIKELKELASRSTPYTVGEYQYELKCTEDVTKACAVLPENMEEKTSVSSEKNVNHYYDIEEDPLIVAESDSNDLANYESEQALAVIPRISEKKETWEENKNENENENENERGAISISQGCIENCNTSGIACSNVLAALRDIMAKIADQLMYLKENEVIDFEEKEFTESEIASLDKEHRTMQEVMYCLESLEVVKTKLIELNFMEFPAEFPHEQVGCCYREYPHVHTNVIGIPIVIKISQTLLELLNCGYPFAAATKPGFKDSNLLAKPTTASRACGCRPVTLKSLFKEKCALAKMIRSRHEANNKNKIVMMTVDPMLDGIFGMRANSLLVEAAFQEREPDLFHVMDMADSNTSLPYVVNRSSLPNVTVCSALDIAIPVLRRQVKNIVVEHPKPRIERELQEIGLDNLLKASRPAKCCKPIALNRTDPDEEPFHASLNSLPLTTSDLQLIVDVAEEENYNSTLCNYHTIKLSYHLIPTIQFRFERYTHFQEQCRSDDIFVPKSCVYLVYYFEIFKKDVYQEVDMVDSVERQRRRNHRRRQRRQQYDTRFPTTETTNYDRHPSRSVISEFFRRLIFSLPNVENSYEAEQQHETNRRKRHSKHRKVDKDTNANREYRSSRGAYTYRVPRRLKNQRLQASSAELDSYMLPDTVPTTYEANDNGIYQMNKISSSTKIYTASTMTGSKNQPFGVKTKESRIILPRDKIRRSKSNLSNIKKKSTVSNVTSSQRTQGMEVKTSEIDKRGNYSFRHVGSKEDLEFDMELSEETRPKGYRHVEKNKCIKELPTSVHNLGTIYECEEKLLNTETLNCASPQSSFLEFLRTSELSKSFQRFVESEEATNIFEKNQMDPEEFWQRYFKSRRESHRLPAKCCSRCSVASVVETETSRTEDLISSVPDNELIRKPSRLPSRIPKRIRAPNSSGDICLKKVVDNAPKNQPEPIMDTNLLASASIPSSKMQCAKSRLSVISKMHSNAEMVKKQQNNADVCLTEQEQTSEAESLHSLRVMGTKNGPGYITILHPACGCPEVSIFIPCYCDQKKKGPKRAGLTTKQMARMTANTNGRHILLPASCRIPRLRSDAARDKSVKISWKMARI